MAIGFNKNQMIRAVGIANAVVDLFLGLYTVGVNEAIYVQPLLASDDLTVAHEAGHRYVSYADEYWYQEFQRQNFGTNEYPTCCRDHPENEEGAKFAGILDGSVSCESVGGGMR